VRPFKTQDGHQGSVVLGPVLVILASAPSLNGCISANIFWTLHVCKTRTAQQCRLVSRMLIAGQHDLQIDGFRAGLFFRKPCLIFGVHFEFILFAQVLDGNCNSRGDVLHKVHSFIPLCKDDVTCCSAFKACSTLSLLLGQNFFRFVMFIACRFLFLCD
jgi:hypothetical protein